jgi:hypothetical protein
MYATIWTNHTLKGASLQYQDKDPGRPAFRYARHVHYTLYQPHTEGEPACSTRGRILGQNKDKSFSPCSSKSSLQVFLEIYYSSNPHSTSYSFYSVLVHCKEKRGKPDRKPLPLPYGLTNPYRSLKYENSQDYAQIPQRNCTYMNSASGSR